MGNHLEFVSVSPCVHSCCGLSFSFFKALCSIEGIVPALETAHGIAYVIKRARELADNQIIVGNLSGRGDKDVREVARVLGDL